MPLHHHGGILDRRTLRRAWRPETLTALACVAVLAAGLHGSDYAAQDYRAWLFRTHGFSLWNSRWYGGHQILGYSVLFPPLAAVFGVSTVAALSCVASTASFRALLGPSRPARVATWWFSLSTVADLIVGRGPFALGLAAGLAALVQARAHRRVTAAVLAGVCGLSSPLTSALLLIAALAWCREVGIRRAAPLGLSSIGLLAALLGGEGGAFPFPLPTFLVFLGFILLLFRSLPVHRATARRTLVIYGAAGCACYLATNPVGGNIVRAATIVGCPISAWVLLESRRRWLLGALVAPMLVWQAAPVTAAVQGARSASSEASYFAPLVDFLGRQSGPLDRVEIPFTRDHWEARYVATHQALARGWERQVDLAHNAMLYEPLSMRAYRQWLDANAVTMVALADVPLDSGGQPEAELLRHPPLWLTPVFTSAHWSVWRLTHPTPMASSPGRVIETDIASLEIAFSQSGRSLVRVRWTSLWHTSAGARALRAPGDWTYVEADHAGTVILAARLPLPWLHGATD